MKHEACARGAYHGLAVVLVSMAGLPAHADQAPAAAADSLEEVIVFGRGEARQVQGITSEQIDVLPPGTSPLKAIEKLAGVNFQSADPYGAYEWSTRLTVRGFNQTQLGFTLDGVPLGDMSYGNHNGLHVSRAIPSENVGRVLLAQGAGALGTASSSNLGGTVQFFSQDPTREVGGQFNAMTGSDSARRVFARLDSGEFGAGTRAYLSAIDSTTDKWKGGGEQKQRQYNVKLVQPIGAATLTAYYDHSDRAETDYQDVSYAILQRRGANWDNFYPNWSAAIAAANACAASGFGNGVVCDDAYWNASGLRKDKLGYIGLEIPAGDSVKWSLKGYSHKNEGQGLWGTPYVPTPGGAPLSIRTTEYDIDRKGLIGSVGVTFGAHEVTAGGWYETNDFDQARRFYGEPSSAGPTRSFLDFQRNPFFTQWQYKFKTETQQFYVQDAWALSDAVKVNFGFKSLSVKNRASTITGPEKSGTIKADEGFLPQVGFSWRLAGTSEVFGQFSRNMRAFESSATAGPFSTTAAGFAAIRSVVKPETSDTFELGLRFRGDTYEGVLAGYRVSFNDRLLAIQQGPGIVGNPAVLANVGGVTTNGLEAALAWRPVRSLTWFNSLSWNDSTYDDNFTSNGTVVPVSGKTVVNTPKILFKSDLAYDDGNWIARIGANHVGERYYTYLNQGSAKAYTLLDAGVGYRFGKLGFLQDLVIQGDVTNLTDKNYISTIGSNGFVNADPTGSEQTLLRGAPRQFFLSIRAKM